MRCRTTIAAAENLGMSQSAVSNAIKHVESQLGFKLFARVSNRLVPTEEAKLMLQEAEPLFVHQQVVRQRAEDIRAGRSGRLRIATTAELSASILPGVIEQFLIGRPDVHLDLDTLPLNAVIDAAETGMIDVGFGIEVHQRHGLHLYPIIGLTAVCVCPADSPLAGRHHVSPGDCSNERLIAPQMTNTIGVLIAEAFAKAGIAYKPMIEVRFLDVAARLVQRNCGITIIDEMSATADRFGDLAVRPFEPQINLTLSAITSTQRTPSRLAACLVATFQAEAQRRVAQIRSNA